MTTDYDADRNAILGLLNEALATELVCVLRYKRHYYMAQGPHAARPGKNSPSTRRTSSSTRIVSPRESFSSEDPRTSTRKD